MQSMKSILVYSHDTFGLGNFRRMLEISKHLVSVAEDISVLLITGSPMSQAFALPERVDTLKLPCLSRDTQGRYGARSLDLSLAQTVRLRANLIRAAFQDFEPDLVLVDKKPFGVEDELAGALACLPQAEQRPKMVLLLRDILDEPKRTRHIWRKNGYFEAIDAYYDQVLVVGNPAVFDLRREYDFPPFAAAKVRFCGYIERPRSQRSRAEVRKTWGVAPHDPWLLVTPGGGEDGFDMVNAAVRGWLALPAAGRARMHIVSGPEMPVSSREALASLSRQHDGLSMQVFSDDMMGLQNAADVVIAMGGYNTVCEIFSSQRRAVLVPRATPSLEQTIRAERLAKLGLIAMVHPDQLTPTRLMEAALRELHAAHAGTPFPRLMAMNGLDGVARNVFELLEIDPRSDDDDSDNEDGANHRSDAPRPAARYLS
jgi:predicted glycosyltransferase